jgi:hypothetical protein
MASSASGRSGAWYGSRFVTRAGWEPLLDGSLTCREGAWATAEFKISAALPKLAVTESRLVRETG